MSTVLLKTQELGSFLNISKAEVELMRVLWHEHPLTVGQVVERVRRTQQWHENTIKTMLNRLVKKGVVVRHKDGGRFFYRANVQEHEFLTNESESLLKRLFGGKTAPLIAHLASQEKLSEEDIAEIEAVLRSMKLASEGKDDDRGSDG